MRIAIDVSQIIYEGTGVANYTSNLVRYILRIDKENDYLLFGYSFSKINLLKNFYLELKKKHDNVSAKFYPYPQIFTNFLWNQLHIVNVETLLGKIDVIHSSDWIQPPAKAKKITTVHDLVVYKYPETSHPYIVSTQKKKLFWVKKDCDLIIADSMSTKNDLVDILKFNPNKIEVVYPGVGYEFKPAKQNEIQRVRQKYNLKDDYILTLGTMEPRKNLNRIISSFEQFLRHPQVANRKREIELVLVGKIGWGEQVKPGKSVRILGFVDNADLPGLYSGASLFVYPSLYEGFGLPVLEAMACGCPVITSDRGSLKEVANQAALLVNPESIEDISSKMVSLLIDEKLRSQVIKLGKANAAEFSWQKTALSILSLYEKLL